MTKDLQPEKPMGGNRMMAVVVIVLVIGIVVALLFLGGVVASRLLSKPEPTVSPTATLAPTFTATAVAEQVPSTATEAVAGPSATPEPVQTSTGESTEPTAAVPLATPTPLAETQPPAAGPAQVASPDYGIQAFLWWQPEVAHRDLSLIRDAGFTWVKQWFAWSDIEGQGKGQYDWSTADRVMDMVDEFGLKLLVRVDHAPAWAGTPPENLDHFADFLAALATRYQGRIDAYQIWNEPNLAREWGNKPPNAQEYTQMLKRGYETIKRIDPNALIVSAGMAPTTELSQRAVPDTQFIQSMYKAGAQPYFDMLGAHGAGYKAPPEMDPGEVANDPNFHNAGDPNCPGDACRIYCFRHVEDLRQIMVDNGDVNKRVAVLEFGWTMDERPDSPYYWHRVADQFVQGDYMVRAYKYAKEHWQPWIGIMSVIYMPDAKWTQADEQYWWSVMEPSQVDELFLKAPYVMLCEYLNEVRGLPRCRYLPAN